MNTSTFVIRHSPSCSCNDCVPAIKGSLLSVLKRMAWKAEKERWDFGDLDSTNYKKFLF